jgi:hypothetical protein
MGVPAGRQLDGAAGREAGTDERVESGLTTFLTVRGAYLMLVNNGEGRTAMTWALCKVCCVVRGAAVRGDGTVS